MNLILDITEKIEKAFQKLWPYQDQKEILRTREMGEEANYFAKLALMSEEERQSHLLKAAEKGEATEKQRAIFREVGYEITDQLNRLSPETYPREDPETPKLMYDFLRRFSLAYSKQGKQRSAGPILEYLLAADYDHAFWLWNEWIGACMAQQDFESTESLIAVATDGSTPAAHHFATRAGTYKPHLMAAKAMIALRRDGDLKLAHEIANNARLTFGESKVAIEAFRGIEYIRQEVAAGRAQIAMSTGKKTKDDIVALMDRRVPAAALITGKWNDEE